MKYDNYIVGGNIIYPLLELAIDGCNYVIYKKKIDELDIYAGKIENDEIVSVDEEILKVLEKKYEEIKNEIEKRGVDYEN